MCRYILYSDYMHVLCFKCEHTWMLLYTEMQPCWNHKVSLYRNSLFWMFSESTRLRCHNADVAKTDGLEALFYKNGLQNFLKV